MMPAAIQRMFGSKNGAFIYGIIYSAFGIAAIVTMFVSKVKIQAEMVLYLSAAACYYHCDLLNGSLMMIAAVISTESSPRHHFDFKSSGIVHLKYWN